MKRNLSLLLLLTPLYIFGQQYWSLRGSAGISGITDKVLKNEKNGLMYEFGLERKFSKPNNPLGWPLYFGYRYLSEKLVTDDPMFLDPEPVEIEKIRILWRSRSIFLGSGFSVVLDKYTISPRIGLDYNLESKMKMTVNYEDKNKQIDVINTRGDFGQKFFIYFTELNIQRRITENGYAFLNGLYFLNDKVPDMPRRAHHFGISIGLSVCLKNKKSNNAE